MAKRKSMWDMVSSWRWLSAILVVVIIIMIGLNQGWISNPFIAETVIDEEENDTTTVTLPTQYTISIKNETGEVLDNDVQRAYVQVYRYAPTKDDNYDSIDDFDEDDYNALTFSDFTQIETNMEDGEKFTINYEPGVDAWYYLVCTCTDGNGYNQETQPLLSMEEYTDENGDVDGVIEFVLLQKPERTVISAVSDEGDQTYNSSITTADVWAVSVLCFDADDELTDDMGYRPYLDFANMNTLEELDDQWVYPLIRVDCNTTTGVNATTIDLSGHAYKEIEVSNGNFDIFFDEDIVLMESIIVDFESGIFGAAGGKIGIEDFEFATATIGGTLTSIDTVL